MLEVIKYGKSVDGKSDFIDRVSVGDWYRHYGNSLDSGKTLGRGSGVGNASVLQRKSSAKPGADFISNIGDLFKIQGTDRRRSGSDGRRVNKDGLENDAVIESGLKDNKKMDAVISEISNELGFKSSKKDGIKASLKTEEQNTSAKQIDKEYMKAVDSGNVETAQKIQTKLTFPNWQIWLWSSVN